MHIMVNSPNSKIVYTKPSLVCFMALMQEVECSIFLKGKTHMVKYRYVFKKDELAPLCKDRSGFFSNGGNHS